jgi:serine/threonine-protein phosphatase 4 catalytic subunit
MVTRTYGFYDECLSKYGSANVWHYCTEVFDYLNLCALIDNQVVCLHGGLSPKIITLDQINKLDRVREVPQNGPISDILWSDPDEEVDGWSLNPRLAGFLYGADVVQKFHQMNGTNLICRSHQLVMEGYKTFFDDTLVNVWAAPNYMYRCGNVAAILELDEKLNRHFKIFEAAPAVST